MSRLLALEWSETEARFAVASAHGDQVTVEQAFSVSMRPEQPGVEQAPGDVGKRIVAALTDRGIRHVDTLVAIGRSNIELRQLTVPPSPDDELPDLVRFTAMREFNALEEDWPLDFLPIDDVPDQPRTVLAAAISPELVEQIQRTCHTAGLKPRRLILRPCGAASLFCRQQAEGRPRARLLVDLLGDEADLTVIIDRKVIFLRTTRLPGDPLTDAEAVPALLAEFRRTIAAVQNQLGGRKVESIVLFGAGQPHAALAELIDSRLATPAEVFDPFAGVAIGGDLKGALPEHPGRFAPLLGMLLDELHHTPHAVDFLHPRHRPEPPSRRRLYVGVGAAAAAVLALLVGGVLYWRFSLDRQQSQLKTEIGEYTQKLESLGWIPKSGKSPKEFKSLKDTVRDIEAWQAHDPMWLEEFRWLVKKLPKADETMLSELQMKSDKRGPEIKLHGYADSTKTATKLESALRETGRDVDPFLPKDRKDPKDYKLYKLEYGSLITRPEVKR